MTSPAPVYKAYARLRADHAEREATLSARLDALLKLARDVESPLLREMKPTIVLALKWKFDYLAKTLESPFELEADVAHWHGVLEMLRTLGEQRWFPVTAGTAAPPDAWRRTADGFDLGWTTTTEGEASPPRARSRASGPSRSSPCWAAPAPSRARRSSTAAAGPDGTSTSCAPMDRSASLGSTRGPGS